MQVTGENSEEMLHNIQYPPSLDRARDIEKLCKLDSHAEHQSTDHRDQENSTRFESAG